MCKYAHLPKRYAGAGSPGQLPARATSSEVAAPLLSAARPAPQSVSSGWAVVPAAAPFPLGCIHDGVARSWQFTRTSTLWLLRDLQQTQDGQSSPRYRRETRTPGLPTAAFESDPGAFPLPSSNATGKVSSVYGLSPLISTLLTLKGWRCAGQAK